jgi:hypothetical protein
LGHVRRQSASGKTNPPHLGFIVNPLPGGKAPGDCGEAKVTKLSFAETFSKCAELRLNRLFFDSPGPYLLA